MGLAICDLCLAVSTDVYNQEGLCSLISIGINCIQLKDSTCRSKRGKKMKDSNLIRLCLRLSSCTGYALFYLGIISVVKDV